MGIVNDSKNVSDVRIDIYPFLLSSLLCNKRELMYAAISLINEGTCNLLIVVVNPSICLSVTFARPTQAIKIFVNVFMPFGTLAIC